MNSDLVGNAAPGWAWKGHRVRLLDGLALTRFERECFSRQFEALRLMQRDISRGDFRDQLCRLREEKGAGAFSLFGPTGQRFLQTQEGAALLLRLILDYDGKTRLDGAAVLFADPEGAAALVKEVFVQSGLCPPRAERTEKGQCERAS